MSAWHTDYAQHISPNGNSATHVWAVRAIQTELLFQSYDPGPVDGVFGDATRSSVTVFQRYKGLKPDGIVGPVTARKLAQLRIKSVARSMSLNPEYVAGIIRVGSKYDFGAVGVFDKKCRGLALVKAPDEYAFDALYSISVICTFLSGALDEFHDIKTAIAAWCIDMQAASYWQENHSTNPLATSYVENVMLGA